MLQFFKNIFIVTGAITIGFSTLNAQQPNADNPLAPANNEEPANSAWKPSLYPDGVIDRQRHVYNVKPWDKIREIDVAWAQRVWSVIPVMEKQNYAFRYAGDEYTNGGAFIEILNHAIKTGKIVAFSSIDDRFTLPLDLESFELAVGGGVDTDYVIDPITREEEMRVTKREFNINSVTKYKVKEDWVFDRNKGRMVRRIIGIAPMKDVYDEVTNRYMYSTAMYWIYYPKAREILGQYEVFNPNNLVKRMTWTDYLEGGYYSYYVEKTSKDNPFGERVKKNGEDLRGLIEGEKVIYDLLDRQEDMWER